MAEIGAQVGESLNNLTKEFDIVAHNLANASTAGYKRRCTAFTKTMEDLTNAGGDIGGETTEDETLAIDMSQGSLVETDRNLDFALYGKGFFVIETPDGPLYTRHGVFQTNTNGQIVDLSGRVVSGDTGPISVPSYVDPLSLAVSSNGRISANGIDIGRLRVVEFPNDEGKLVPVGDTCFRVPKEVEPLEVSEPMVKQGYQEASNVKVVEELVNMITVARMYEANMRLMSVAKDTTSSMINVAMS